MGKVIETVREVNNFVRNTALVGLTAVLGAGGYLAYDKVTSEERKLLAAQSELVKAKTQVDELTRDVAAKQQQIDKLDTSIKLLKVDQRLARIDVLDQQVDSETGKTITTLNFVELSPDGNAISEPRELKVQGDTIYIDNWVVKFEDRFIEEADLIRGTSLTLFRRAFGDQQQPTEGVSLDEVGGRPGAYARGGEMTEFEKEIWDNFWTIANDPGLAEKKGIRAAHGEAVSMKAEKGKSYRIVLRASDGLSIVPNPAATAPN